MSLWTKFTQYFSLSGAVEKNANQAFKFDGFMCHGYIFSPLLKLLSCLARGGTAINVGVIQIAQTDTSHRYVMDFKLISPPTNRNGIEAFLKLLENTVQNKKSSFQWRLRDLLSKFHGRTTECKNYLVKNNPASVLSGSLLSPI